MEVMQSGSGGGAGSRRSVRPTKDSSKGIFLSQSQAFSEWLALERARGEFRYQLKSRLRVVEGKFSWSRLNGLLALLDLFEGLLGVSEHSGKAGAALVVLVAGAGAADAESGQSVLSVEQKRHCVEIVEETQCYQRVFRSIVLDEVETVSKVSVKEKSVALELLRRMVELGVKHNPHSKGFMRLVSLVVESAQPALQAPTLRLLLALLRLGQFHQKSFRKAQGLAAIARWLHEQYDAATALPEAAIKEVMEAASDLLTFLISESHYSSANRTEVEKMVGTKLLNAMLRSAQQNKKGTM